jgi:ribokinase
MRARVAVVGHVEHTRLVFVERLPASGDIIHAEILWEGPAGGGAVAAVQLAKLAGGCTLFTALGRDAIGHRIVAELSDLGVAVRWAPRDAPTREAVSLIDRDGERTTLTFGPRLQPQGGDALGWDELCDFDAVYFAAGDAEVLARGRRARVLVATSRELETVAAAGVHLDGLVGSGRDPAECFHRVRLPCSPGLVVITDSERGGRFTTPNGITDQYPAIDPGGPVVDSYGAGDSFAGALTFALALSLPPRQAVALAARCGASCVTGRGPFAGQLTGEFPSPAVPSIGPSRDGNGVHGRSPTAVA